MIWQIKGIAINTVKEEINEHLRVRYKQLFNKIIIPAMLTTSFFLIVSHWEAGNDKIMYGILTICLIVIFNLSLCLVTEIPTPWGNIPARSDAFDALRWCINFPLDIYIIYSLEANLAAAVIAWLLLTFGAMTEVYSQRSKLLTISVAFSSFCILIFRLYETELRTQVYLVAGYMSLVFILWKLQQYIGDEMARVLNEKLERKHLENEANALQRDAAIGHSTRAIQHELNTLIGVANLSVMQIDAHNKSDSIHHEIERLDKSLSYMGQVSSLILDGLGNRHANKRIISLAELEKDLRLLLCIDADYYLANIEFDFPDNAEHILFEERTGSIYLVIHNLVKNAHDAITEKHGKQSSGQIRIRALKKNNTLEISIYDNGIGLSEQVLSDIKNRCQLSNKLNGHGLGMRFVQSECDKNHMQLQIESVEHKFSVFTLHIALQPTT